MANYNNIIKAIETLNSYEKNDNTNVPDDKTKIKTEKMSCCTTIANGICCQTGKVIKNFSQILGISIRTLLQLCDDDESDVRMIADECLNRIIKSTCDNYALKIQFELYNEIHKNGRSRILRSALKRFGILSHTIRPIKGQVYISNLIPCIVEISKRQEEEIIDTLSQTLPLILDTLGPIMRDKHAKLLLKSFYPNLSSSQSIIRRNSSNMILTTCLHCRKPRIYLFYALRYLIDTIINLSDINNDDNDDNINLIVGILGCLKIIIPHMDNDKLENDPETDTIVHRLECLLQIYELCLKYIQWHSHHNVVNAALETLAQLLRSPNEELINQLTSINGPTGGSRILAFQKNFNTSPSTIVDKIIKQDDDDDDDDKLNIGTFNDEDVSLKYCCRYIALTFLLTGKPGELIADKLFRVSVKSLSLICLANAIRLYPNILMETLEIINEENKLNDNDKQMMCDILLYANHSDPQLRGNVSTIISYFLNAIYVQYEGSYLCLNETIKIDNLIELLIKGLKDESSLTCRQTLISLNSCSTCLLESEEYKNGLKLINNLLPLVKNQYFLVKISLSQVISELPFTTIKYLDNNLQFQNEVLEILMQLIGDQDHRVRNSASESIVKFVKTSFIEKYKYHDENTDNDNENDDEILKKTSQYFDDFLNQIIMINPLETRLYKNLDDDFFVNSLVEPFLMFYTLPKIKFSQQKHQQQLESCLKIIVNLLHDKLIINPSKYQYYGCYETLNKLSSIYSTTLYPDAWGCQTIQVVLNDNDNTKINSSNRNIVSELSNIDIDFPDNLTSTTTTTGNQLFSLTLKLLSSDSVSLDLSIHKHMLLFAGNLMSGIVLKNLKHMVDQQTNDTDTNTNKKMWNLFIDTELNANIEALFIHIMKIINIFVHVIDERQVTTISTNKIGLMSLPLASSLSPRKKFQNTKNNDDNNNQNEQKIKDNNNKIEFKNPLSSSSFKSSSFSKDIIGSFSNSSHYMKLYEILKAANLNYNSTLDADASQMYLGLLNSSLEVLSQILEISSTYEARKLAEETLHYLETTLSLSPTITIQCVRQLLKSLFSTNLCARWDELEEIRSPDNSNKLNNNNNDDIKKGLYEYCFQKPTKYITTMIKKIGNNCRHNEYDSTSIITTNRIRRDSDRKIAIAFRSFARSNNQKVFFSSFIRIFETMVIKSLNRYTTTNSVNIQCQVLLLLSQLVKFHVNYCLLDTDKTFIDFVLGQFQFIEESQIPNVELLLPKIFCFLVNLSYEKYHTKLIIDLPEIIKLCDGLMASEQPALTHCIPALIPVVEDIFLSRNKIKPSERQELDTTREYLMSMLLRLVEHHLVIDLLSQCLAESRHDDDGEEKWRKWSRMTLDSIIPALSAGRIRIEYEEAAISLIKLFSVLSPMVLRPVDPLLKILFTVPPTLEQSRVKLERWIGMINIILLSLISYAKEDVMLSRLNELCVYMTELVLTLDLPHTFTIYDTADPLNATNSELSTCRLSPEQILSIFLFRVINHVVKKITQLLHNINYREKLNKLHHDIYLIKELSFFLQLCIYMFESGSHCKIANATIKMINENSEFIPIEELNNLMLKLAKKNCPILSIQWIYLLTLIGYNKQNFWSNIMNNKTHNNNNKENIDEKIIRQCSMILFCDHIYENINDTESLICLLDNHVEEIINLSNESPVRDLVTVAIHRESTTSQLLINAITKKCLTHLEKPIFLKKLLRTFETAHDSQSGAIILILIEKLIDSSDSTLTKIANKIIIKKIEYLLSSNHDIVLQQLTKNNIINIMKILECKKIEKNNLILIGMINNLAATFYDLSPIELQYCRPFNPVTIKNIVFDKNWFLLKIQEACCGSSIEISETAKLLSFIDLTIDDCDDILMSNEFNLDVLTHCIKFGARLTIEENIKNTLFKKSKNIQAVNDDDEINLNYLSNIFISSKKCLSYHVKNIIDLIPQPHDVYEPMRNNENENKYTLEFKELMENKVYWKKLFSIIPAVTQYIKTLVEFQDKDIIYNYEKLDDEYFAKFAVLCLEIIHWMIYSEKIRTRYIKQCELELCLNCSTQILKNENICHVFGNDNNYSLVCSAANTLTKIIDYWSKNKNYNYLKNPKDEEEQSRGLIGALENEKTHNYARACLQMSSLICWIKNTDEIFHNDNDDMPYFIKDPTKALIIIVSRQDLVNSFVLTPPLIWKRGWSIEGSGPTLCHFPILLSTGEINYLQDLDILEQFIYRITLLGWTSRPQFEEIWMVLLAVLNDSMEKNLNNSQSIIFALDGISKILTGTLILPQPGNPVNSIPMHNCRDPPLSLQKSSCKKLYTVQDLISWKYECSREEIIKKSYVKNTSSDSIYLQHLFTRGNMERDNIIHSYDKFSYSQLSVFYLWSSTSLHEDKLSASVIKLKNKRLKLLKKYTLDLDSCIKFLIDLLTRWMQTNTNITIKLLENVIKCVISISDLFIERGQFQWMFDTCTDLQRYHSSDAEILQQYLIFAVCKSAAVLIPLDSQSLNKIKKAIDCGLKSNYLPCKISTLNGILYLLQSAVQTNYEETINVIHPLIFKYIQNNIDIDKKQAKQQQGNILSKDNDEHYRLLWAIVFFLLEHTEDNISDSEPPAVLKLALNLVTINDHSMTLYRTIIQGLERLVATKSVAGNITDQIIRISLERIKHQNLLITIPALRLLITCMYTESADNFNQNNNDVDKIHGDDDDELLNDIDPELFMKTIERTSVIFDRIKKGNNCEVEIMCAVLSVILADFFPPFETLTKVIGEFLSPQQTHQRLLSSVVFSVCERVAGNAKQLTLLQDWVVFSLPNFIQSLPLATSIWCLSCFFFGSSTNKWLRALFPYVQSRIGKYEYEDKELFFIGASDFYKQLSTEAQRKAFIESFEEAGKEPGSLFRDIVNAF
ncbi:hypothetical protein HCN44_002011 [Aphidius gifuensis]|uniref:Uncharacterized protein n=1 Tax=Aphidius gifuensis TaxID=684658 RepID=A0A835CUP8_APHGI|nr:huntingtin [Aphidius gifuensis]KAF7996379.1 hypothetical protein HCN44_002011 [Aphidius gifuensis]